jgi:hypothetical protein
MTALENLPGIFVGCVLERRRGIVGELVVPLRKSYYVS